jgi:adenine-specific DNA-methyltransferase
LLNNIIGKRFSFPKSLYAVHDCIAFLVANKPNALIVDFFAGSGTTLHAVNLLNAEDGGHRRCIMVTNNEVSVEEAKSLTAQGYKPGDAEWERLGIARYVNWPRTVCSIEGHDVNGQPLKGEYLGTDHRQMADGFETNAIFFRLNFLDKNNVALGKQFRELLPLLWMKSGAIGTCPILDGEAVPDMLVLPNNEFAVLNNEKAFGEFFQQIMENESIRMVYLIVDSDAMYREMAKALTTGLFASRHIKTCQLYRDYLDNFRINIPR